MAKPPAKKKTAKRQATGGPKKPAPRTGRLFRADHPDFFEQSYEEQAGAPEPGGAERASVECLGLTFASDDDRRSHFLDKLREKLRDPEFRKTPGFPKGTDEDILKLSDPPYYTACPNPFLAEFVRCYGTPDDPTKPYHREPFAVDVSVGKTDPLYKAHGYHTKVPHLAIVPSVLHYTKPGDLVLDGFAGSGMTGVAAQWCGTAPPSYRRQIEDEWTEAGFGKPEWGARRAILGDLSPAATFIAANYTLPFDVAAFARAGKRILDEVDRELGWMYETRHTDGRTGRINYTVWSEVFSCPECAGEVVFVEEALNKKTKRVRDDFPCPSCRATLTKDRLDQSFETLIDPATGAPWKRIRLQPVLVNYDVGDSKHEKSPDKHDLAVIGRAAALPLPPEMPTNAFPIPEMYHGSRLAPKGFTSVHHLFLAPAAQTLAALWRRGSTERDSRLRSILLFFVEQAIWTCSVLNRFRPTGYSQVNQVLGGVYYVPSQHSEVSLRYVLDGKLTRLTKAFRTAKTPRGITVNTTGDCAVIGLPDATVDYVFTDPPFGANIPYADLNFVVESWHRVLTNTDTEAIIDHPKRKGLHEYQDLMRRCFSEYHRVLKPGHWMTVVFSNSSNAVWRAIQEAIGMAGFVIAEVRTLDKQQGSYRQETSSAMNQDLVISAYKPTDALARRTTVTSVTEENAWAFVTEHLGNAAPPRAQGSTMEVVKERTAQMLHDRMVAFHVQRDIAVPVGASEFFAGLERRFVPRDGMYFLPEQVIDYDRRRAQTQDVRQLDLFVTDEATAIQWVRQELTKKPQSSQDLVPVFMRQLQAWAKHERMIELRDVLQDNFLRYDGDGPVPAQIHSYLSSNYKDLRNLDKADPKLVAMARDRWYVPDPGKQAERDKLRERALLREFEEYRTAKPRTLREFRTEAVRAGFKDAYDRRDYRTIVDVGRKLPESVLQEDEKLLMYYDVASARLGDN